MRRMKRSARKKPPLPELEWFPMATFSLIAFRGDRLLAVLLQQISIGGRWAAIALESKAPEGGSGAGFADIFGDHAHQVIGESGSLEGIMRGAKAYARAWKKKKTPEAPCDCGEIE